MNSPNQNEAFKYDSDGYPFGEYQTCGLKNTFQGTGFQWDLTLFFLMHLIENSYRFSLATEIKAAGQFEDLVMFYGKSKSDRSRFLQIKHKITKNITSKDLLCEKGPFSLTMYFDSYQKIKDNFYKDNNSNDFDIIIATNTTFDFENQELCQIRKLSKTKIFLEKVSGVDDIFNDIGELYRFPSDHKRRNMLVKELKLKNDVDIDIDQFNDYLNRIIFLVDLPDEEKLNEINKSKFKNEFRNYLNLVHVNDIWKTIRLDLLEWITKKTGAWYTHKDFPKQIEHIKNNETRWSMISSTNRYKERIKNFGIQFEENCIPEQLSEFLNDDHSKLLKFITPPKLTILGSIQISQLIDSDAKYKNHFFLSINELDKLGEKLTEVFKNEDIHLVLIENDRTIKEGNSIFESIWKSIENECNYKIVLVTSPNEYDPFTCNVDVTIPCENNYFKKLNLSSRNKLLNKIVTFQGEPIALSQLVSKEDVGDIIDSEILELLIADKLETIRLFQKASISKDYEQNYYIDRKFCYRPAVNEKIFKSDIPDVRLVISPINNTRYILWSLNLSQNEIDEKVKWGKTLRIHLMYKNVPSDDKIQKNKLYLYLKNNYIYFATKDLNGDIRRIKTKDRRSLRNIKNILKDQSQNSTLLKSDIKSLSKMLFDYGYSIITELNESEAEKPIIFLKEKYAAEEFEHLCKTVAENQTKVDVHWLKNASGKFIWQKSNGSVSKLSQFINENYVEEFTEEKLLRRNKHITIISDDPGMGKSTVLTSLSIEMKKIEPTCCVIRFDLRSYTKFFSNLELTAANEFNPNDLDETYQLFLELLQAREETKLKTNFEITFLKYFFTKPSKLLILFDGFDEIGQNYQCLVSKLLLGLKNCQTVRFFITTRPNLKSYLEDKLNEFSFALKPFSIINQVNFLKKYFNEISSDCVLKIVKEFFKTIKSNKINEFSSNPLHIRMMAEVLQKDEKFDVNAEIDYRNFNICSIYETFIEYKYFKIYEEEKKKSDMSNAAVQLDAKKNYKKSFKTEHQLLALYALFPIEKLNEILTKTEIEEYNEVKKVIEANTDTGGIIIEMINEVPIFVHRSFAEYFVACFLSDELEKKSNRLRGFFFLDLFLEKNKLIRLFFDQKLITQNGLLPLHQSVLKNDVEKAKQLISNGYPKEVDIAGRTALHLAASYNHYDIAELLFEINNSSANDIDSMFEWTPLRYAVKFSNWKIVELLLEENTELTHLELPDLESKMYKEKTVLHIAVIENYRKVIKSVINFFQDNEEDVATLIFRQYDETGKSPFEYAIKERNSEIMRLFINVQGFKQLSDDEIFKLVFKNLESYYSTDENYTKILEFLLKAVEDPSIYHKLSKVNRNTLLHLAAKCGHSYHIKLLLEQYRNKINYKNEDGNSPLYLACNRLRSENQSTTTDRNYIETIKFLIANGANIISVNKLGRTPLFAAVERGHISAVNVLLNKEADVKITDIDGNSVLLIAIKMGHLDFVKILQDHGADIKIRNKDGQSSLFVAAEFGQLHIFNFLIDKGAQILVNAVDNYGNYPLIAAARNGHFDIVKKLIDHESEINLRSKYGNYPLMLAIQNGHSLIVKELIHCGANKDIKNEKGESYLYFAAELGHVDIVKILIEKGFEIDAGNINGQTPLIAAAASGRVDVLDILIKKKADVTVKDVFECTAIFYASANGHTDCVKILKENEANINVENKFGRSPIMLAAVKGHSETVKFLFDNGAKINEDNQKKYADLYIPRNHFPSYIENYFVDHNAKLIDMNASAFKFFPYSLLDDFNINEKQPLLLAVALASVGHLDIVEILLENGAEINAKVREDYSPLTIAAENNHFDVVEFLIIRGADLNDKNIQGHSLLYYSIKNGEIDILRFLIKNFVKNVNSTTANGKTPLYTAAQFGQLAIVKFLVECNAEIDKRNDNSEALFGTKFGSYPLMTAAGNGYVDIVNYLIDRGAKVNLGREDGYYPLHFAALSGHSGIVKTLIERNAEINTKIKNGKSPLHLATSTSSRFDEVFNRSPHTEIPANSGQLDVVNVLLDNGAEISSKDSYGYFPLMYAAQNGYLTIVKAIIQNAIKTNADNEHLHLSLSIAAEKGYTEIVQYLIRHGARVNLLRNNCTPLCSAARWDHIDVVKCLLNCSKDVNIGDVNNALFHAVDRGYIDIVNILLDNDADVNASYEEEISPLMVSAKKGHTDISAALILNGANINARDDNGHDSLYFAARFGHFDTFKILLEYGAQIEDTDYCSLINIAKKNMEILHFLMNHR